MILADGQNGTVQPHTVVFTVTFSYILVIFWVYCTIFTVPYAWAVLEWRSGKKLVLINKVTLCQTRLILGWFRKDCTTFTLICTNQLQN